MSSRLIVKNLPNKIKEKRIREVFSSKGGEITDIKLCFTKNGNFRKFGFVGFKNAEDALQAKEFLNNTFIDTSKIQVDECKSLGDLSVPRPWSKYTEGSSAFSRKANVIEERKKKVRELQGVTDASTEDVEAPKKVKNKVLQELEDIEEDEGFQEFLAVHTNKKVKKTWGDEVVTDDITKKKKKKTKNDVMEDKVKKAEESDSADDESEDDDDMDKSDDDGEEKSADNSKDDVKEEEKVEKSKGTPSNKMSDLSWLRSKVVKTTGETSTTEDVTTQDEADRHSNATDKEESEEEGEKDAKVKVKSKKSKVKSKDGSEDKLVKSKTKSDNSPEKADVDQEEPDLDSCITLKMRGIPFKCTEKDVVQFFKKCKISDIRFPMNKKGKRSGYAFVDFDSSEDLQRALKKNGKTMGSRYVELFAVKNVKKESTDDRKWNKQDKAAEDQETELADSGRIFVRNLPFTCTESDLESYFGKYGKLSEVNLPIDKRTNKAIGYAFVTFELPEHGVKAFNELDGSVFQGRMIHLLPSHAKKEDSKSGKDGGASSSYKKAKEAEQKTLSASSHNWNALFLGQNAVADVMASKMNTAKSNILDAESSKSVAVRMALGETEIVSDTREFLESHGVILDVFGQADAARSKEVLLVKNLPAGTTSEELREVFAEHGNLGRVLMPPFGITAIIEFLSAKDAKQAFRNLAYSKFKHIPLFLEWAPINILSGEVQTSVKKEEEEKIASDASDEEDDATDGNTLFVKNLNFDTTEESLKEKFCSCGKVKSATIAKKKDPKKPGSFLSMGYGFVEYKKAESADKALRMLQLCEVDGHKLELKKSHRESIQPKASRKRASEKKQTTSKILVRNIPFEANVKEVKELFSAFGEIKSLRLPKKMSGTGSHRGFAFVDFLTKQDAKRAFKALCQSTHLYGRRLVLEWAEEEESVDEIRMRTAKHFTETEPEAKKRKTDILADLEKTTG